MEPFEVSNSARVRNHVNQTIDFLLEEKGVSGSKYRYKMLRALALHAFAEIIATGKWDELVERTLDSIDDLPSGYQVFSRMEIDKSKSAKKTVKKSSKKAVVKEVEEEPEIEVTEEEVYEEEPKVTRRVRSRRSRR